MNATQIVSMQEMKQLDKLTISTNNITSFDLMKQAAEALTNYLLNHNMTNPNESYLVIAGPGNNGGDALLVGHYLSMQGYTVQSVIVGPESSRSDDSLLGEAYLTMPTILHITSTDQLESLQDKLDQSTVLIDGLFGIGLTRHIEGLFYDVITRMNQSYASKISIDIPSGIQADNGLVMGTAVHATHTLIVQNYKQGNLLNDAKDYHGVSHLVNVGILQTMFPERQEYLDLSYLYNKIPSRQHNSYKYHYGNLLTIGGSKGMMGAPLLSSYTALRCGVGLSHLLYHDKYASYINNPYPDVMMNTYLGIEEIPQIVSKKTAIIFGPGLGRKDDINLEVLRYLLSTDVPLVVDADGIYYLTQILETYSKRPNIIITPHYKEMADFLGIPIEEVIKEPVLYAKNIAHTYNLTVVLKGTCTIITNNEFTFFSDHGVPGLATAGTGDVLAGIIGSFLAKQYDPLDAAKLGVLIHSQAAQLTQLKWGEESMIASDIIDTIPQVIKDAKS